MGSTRHIALSATSVLLACAAPADSTPVNVGSLSCQLTGQKWAGASEEDICSIFTHTLQKLDVEMPARIELEALSPDTARAIAFDGHDEIVGESNLSVTDRQIGRSSWETLARGLAQAIAKGKF